MKELIKVFDILSKDFGNYLGSFKQIIQLILFLSEDKYKKL